MFYIDSSKCTGCGACSAMCHSHALWIPGFSTEQIEALTNSYLSSKSQAPLIISFSAPWTSILTKSGRGKSRLLTIVSNVIPVLV